MTLFYWYVTKKFIRNVWFLFTEEASLGILGLSNSMNMFCVESDKDSDIIAACFHIGFSQLLFWKWCHDRGDRLDGSQKSSEVSLLLCNNSISSRVP
jgi:hypothetical protein